VAGIILRCEMSENVAELVDREIFEAVSRMNPLLVSVCERLYATRMRKDDFLSALNMIGISQFVVRLLDGVYSHLSNTERNGQCRT